MIAATTRLAYAAGILEARAALAGGDADARRRVMLAGRIAALRARLLGGTADAIDARDPVGSLPAMQAHLEALKGLPDLQRVQRAEYLRIIAAQLLTAAGNLGVPGPDMELLVGALREADTAAQMGAGEARNAQQAHEFSKTHAEWMAGAVERLNVVVLTIQDAARKLEDAGIARQQAMQEFVGHKTHDLKMAAIAFYESDVGIDAPNRGRTMDEREQKRARYREMIEAVEAAKQAALLQWEAENPAPEVDPTKAALDAARDIGRAIGREAHARVLDASPVSEQQAQAWAAAQEIPADAVRQLKSQGYPVEKLRADMAEFYRLTGGRLAQVKIRASKLQRAYATNIHGHETSVITLSSGFSKRTLFHELGHHLEADPQALAAARGFLINTRRSDKLRRLKDIVRGSGYGPKEVAFENGWVSPYVGKVYGTKGKADYMGITEVFSMGVEAFCDPAVLADRMAMDPRHTTMVMGYLTASTDPLFDAVKAALAQRKDAEDEADEEHRSEVDELIDRAGSALAWVAVTQDELKFVEDHNYYLGRYFLRADSPAKSTPIGRIGSVIALDCKKLKDQSTGRSKRGIVLMRIGSAIGPDREGGQSPQPSISWTKIFSGEKFAKTVAAMWDKLPPDAQPPKIDMQKLREAADALSPKKD